MLLDITNKEAAIITAAVIAYLHKINIPINCEDVAQQLSADIAKEIKKSSNWILNARHEACENMILKNNLVYTSCWRTTR